MTWGRWRTRQRFITWTILLLRNKLPCFPTFCRCFLKIHRSKPMFSAENPNFKQIKLMNFRQKSVILGQKLVGIRFFSRILVQDGWFFPEFTLIRYFLKIRQCFCAIVRISKQTPAKIRYFSWKLVEIGLLIQYFGQNGLFWITAPSSGTGISVKSNQSYELFNA